MQATETIIIRHGTSDDNRLLAALGRQTFADSFAADNRPEDMRAYLDAAFSACQQASELDDPRSVFLIAEIGSRPAGGFLPSGRFLFRGARPWWCPRGSRPDRGLTGGGAVASS